MFSILKIIKKGELFKFCQENHIKKLSLFGSALRDELKAESDIDLLVDFEDEHIPGLLKLAGIEIELTKMIGRKVDLRTPAELSRYFRNDVLAKARVEYVA